MQYMFLICSGEGSGSVRVHSGKPETYDGPFAAKIPTAAFGSIEVRPVQEM